MFKNKNIKLEPLSIKHLDYIMKWVNDPAVTGYFAGAQKKINKKEEKEYILNIIRSKNDRVFSVFDGKKYIGQTSINQIYWPARNGRLFLVIVKKFQGKGYGKIIIKKILNHAFNELNLHKIYLIVRAENEKAIYLYHRCGFRQEGVLKEEYFVKGKYWDMMRMAILKDAYQRWRV